MPYGYVNEDPVNNIDPLGLSTVGDCGGASAAIPRLGGVVGTFCVTRVVAGGPDQIGVVITGGVAKGAGVDIGGGPYLEISNATDLKQLGGPFLFFTASDQEGAGPSVVFFVSPNGKTYGAAFGLSFGAGVAIGTGVSDTYVRTFGGLTGTLLKAFWSSTTPGNVPVDGILKWIKGQVAHHQQGSARTLASATSYNSRCE